MKILLDHNIPHGLRGALADHDVHTADYVGWGRLRNGDLLEVAASNGYEIFITCDQGIPYEQNLGLELGASAWVVNRHCARTASRFRWS